MTNVITVEREYGSLGAEFANALAKTLGWRLIDRGLVEEIAQKACVDPAVAEECDERLDPWYHRMGKAFWQGSTEVREGSIAEATFDSERMAKLVEEQVHRSAEAGNCVIVGRGAACILSSRPGAFHVFVHASMKRKLKWFEQNFPAKARAAEDEITATDQRRAAYIRRFYNRDWADRRLYHMMINSCMGQEAMIESVLVGSGIRSVVGV